MDILKVYTKTLKNGYALDWEFGHSIEKCKGILGKLGLEKVKLKEGINLWHFWRPYKSLDEMAQTINDLYIDCKKEGLYLEIHFSEGYGLKRKIKKINPQVKIVNPIRQLSVSIESGIRKLIPDEVNLYKRERLETLELEQQLEQKSRTLN